jgi:hypothetical protein
MSDYQHDDLETKVEDAFIALLATEADDRIKGIYAWADDAKDEPCIIVKATRGAADSTQWGDIIDVEVSITLRHAKTDVPRGLMRCVENGIGLLQDTTKGTGLPKLLENASNGGLRILPEPTFGGSSKSYDGTKITREMIVNIKAAHLT